MAEEIIRAYPDAKIILTIREDEERWLRSFLDTLWYNYTTWSHWFLRNVDSQWREQGAFLSPFYERFHGDPVAHGLRVYREHKAVVQRVTEPKERLLVYDVNQGWGPLCAFLQQHVPTENFPKTNGVDDHRALFGAGRRKALKAWASNAMLKRGLPVILTAVLWMFRSRVVSSIRAGLAQIGLRPRR
ncbi:hypothetical protein DOTSEDRAFT_73380 [Dothistroma septosporum NZE10]|uniref:Sulfotransferase domain-containing protein n=1 Tax=Dothistroma septosporum (strain NZE10 / CBS 128990) TaxID=675120 RepID=N1PLT6_DOTSN|nr:hypothetical protein DOTSEDRAFT_73380 [Dothistroma septosporum NZE10]